MELRIGLKKKLGGVLANPALLDKALRRASKAGAEEYTGAIHDWIAAGKAFTPRTGTLENSIGWRGVSGRAAEVFASAEYAPFVEFGTRAHVIRPRKRKGLRFFSSGKDKEARVIYHPGTRPRPFFFINMSRRTLLVTRAMEEVIGEELGLED